jgi:PIN domain nuclease of toxin-antitoxin system
MTDYLFDTHALVWWWTGNPALPEAVAREISDERNTIHVSAVCAWEIATKCRIGKWDAAIPVFEKFEYLAQCDGFVELGVSVPNGLLAGSLPAEHRDPFDRMIAAQAIHDDLTVITRDPALALLGCRVYWERD